MGTKKKLMLPEEILVLETDHDLAVTIEIIESDSYEARIAEFLEKGRLISTSFVGRISQLSKCFSDAEACG